MWIALHLCSSTELESQNLNTISLTNFENGKTRAARFVQARKQADFNTTNVGDNYFRNNDRYFRVPPCHIAQYKNSFFACTIEWNCPDNSAVNVDSMASFRLLTHQMRNSELCSFSLFISLFLLIFLKWAAPHPHPVVLYASTLVFCVCFFSNVTIQIQRPTHA